ncbi:MAG TPA: hypothetical protein VD994_17295, partial [Prosthecobacter sp.]|nr:hypothetical protein [Prosthecobacter sp.]
MAAFENAPAMHPAPSPNAAASPFSVVAPLFRTMPGESVSPPTSQPSSPFATPASANTGSPLTVADVLPQLPPEVARFGALSPDQPVAVSPQVLDAALRSGQAALPIFEIYRVCPALFQTPVSPQDPRMIPLPASKLPRLIANAQQTPVFDVLAPDRPATGESPFGATPASPFGLKESPASMPAGTGLPPRRQGPPPSLADGRDVSPSNGFNPSPSTSPFSAAASVDTPGTSPFGVKPEDPKPAQPGLFASQSEPSPSSPFAMLPAKPASPFGTPAPSPQPPTPTSPFGTGTQPAASAFSSLFGGSPLPSTTEPPPAPQSQPPVVQPLPSFSAFGAAPATPEARSVFPAGSASAPSPFGAAAPTPATAGTPFPPAPPAHGGGTTFRVSLATLLKGYSAAELGFDPVVVPAWIMTTLPTVAIREQMAGGSVTANLGTLVDGITDVGFRNVLSHVKRDFELRLPIPELTAAMAAGAPPAATPTFASVNPPAQFPAAQAPATMRIEPPTVAPAAPHLGTTSEDT